MNENDTQALEHFENLLGAEKIQTDQSVIAREANNTLGLSRKIHGILYPSSTEEVCEIVRIANRFLTPLYPISKGNNIGYGEKLPVLDGQIIVNLSRMNRIRSFDDVRGYVTLEPGVNQKQLYEYLVNQNTKFWMDATGAGLDSSIIGNSLEGGFGHTPKGDRRNTVSGYEIVLGNGAILETGTFPGLGPDMSGLLVQSNFGIVTAARIELMPIPEHFESYVITVQEDPELELLVDLLRSLRQSETLTSLVLIANAVRSLMTTVPFPTKYADELITSQKAIEILSSPALKVGHWSAIGGLYGSAAEVKARKKTLKKRIGRHFRIRFFNDSTIAIIKRMMRMRLLKNIGMMKNIGESIESYSHVYGLMKGIPSDHPLQNIKWRVPDIDRMGLLWFSPTVAAVGSEVRKVVKIAERLFMKNNFELPITVTLVKPDQVVMVLSINFDLLNEKEKERAFRLYHELKTELEEVGVYTYRSAIPGMQEITYRDKGKNETLGNLKRSLDPNNIISPGRYGININTG